MKRKVIILLMAVLAVLAVLPFVSFAGAGSGSVVFKDASTGLAINEIANVKNINTEVAFTPSQTGEAYVITAAYDGDGAMSADALLETIDVVSGVKTEHTTASFDVTKAEAVKVFVWMKDTMTPVINPNGLLTKAFSGGVGFSEKFVPVSGCLQENPYVIVKNKEVSLGELFTVLDGAEVNSKYFSVICEPVNDSAASAQFVANASNWENSTITFSGEGLLKITVLDYDFCVPTEMYVNVVLPVDRYTTVFENTDTYLYRIGNSNSVSLKNLFKADDEAALPISGTNVTIDNVQGDANGEFTANASNWENGKIKFSGMGVVDVTISDDNSNSYSLLLEVVNGENVTAAKSASTDNIVLLNNVSGSFSVSNGKTFYGNGFTVTLPTASVQNKGAGFTGYVNLGNASGVGGNLDNVKIVGPVYPKMNIYRSEAEITDSSDPDYGDGYNMRYFRNSVMVLGGSCTITNSYISGSRAALRVSGGNVVIENSTLSGGAYANAEITGGTSVTLRDVTTIQTDVLDSYGKGVYAHGLGIAVNSAFIDINIEGELKQYNWLCEEQWNNAIPSGYSDHFPKFFTASKFDKYWHYLDGGDDPYVNLGFIYECNWDITKINDNRTNVDYDTCDANIAGVNGGVYSKVNTVGGNTITDAHLDGPTWVPSGFNPMAPVLTFDNTNNADPNDADDDYDTYCVYEDGALDIGVKAEGKTLDISGVSVKKDGIDVPYKVYLNGVEVSGTSVLVSADNGISQSLVFKTTIDGLGYDPSGNPVDGQKEYAWKIPIKVATLDFPAPEWNMGGNYSLGTSNCYYVYYSASQGYGEAVPIYEGVKVKYYNSSGTLIEKDFSGTQAIPTGSNNANENSFIYELGDGSVLTMKLVTGSWKQYAVTHQFTNYKNMTYIYPQSLDNDNYIRPKTTSYDFNVKITYMFTDPNGQSTDTVTMNWYSAKANNGSIKTEQWKTFDSINGKKASICVTGDTLVTLSDGSQKRADSVTYSDEILAWDFYKGEYVTAPVSLLINHGYDTYEIVGTIFDDGTKLNIVGSHGIFNKTLNEFVDIDSSNVADFVGDTFCKATEDGFVEVKLVDYEIRNEYNNSVTILSAIHHNAVLNEMLTISPSALAVNLYEPFEVGEDMRYDAEKMREDIETYGLYTYEEFSEYITKEQFDSWGIANMKVVVGKGYTTYDVIVGMLEEFAVPNA